MFEQNTTQHFETTTSALTTYIANNLSTYVSAVLCLLSVGRHLLPPEDYNAVDFEYALQDLGPGYEGQVQVVRFVQPAVATAGNNVKVKTACLVIAFHKSYQSLYVDHYKFSCND